MLHRSTQLRRTRRRPGPREVLLWALLFAMPSCDSCNPEPELRVTPSSFTIDPLDDAAVITVRNVGDADLDWSAASETDWIVLVTPSSGSLPAGSSEDVEISFDTSVKSFGSSTGEVRFSANGRIPTWSVVVTCGSSCPGPVGQPESGAVWIEGETHDIAWVADGLGTVQIDLVSGAEFRTIAAAEPNDGSYSWLVNGDGLADPLCEANHAIRVTLIGGPECSQLSQPFCVKPTSCTQPPEIACSPSPFDQATGISSDANLSWACGDSPCGLDVRYRVFFGTNSSPALVDSTTTKSWDLPVLAAETQYYWKIESHDTNGTTSSPVWQFSTAGAPCDSVPYMACDPAPISGGTNTPIDTDLSWNCGDSPCGLAVTYHVYFGTNPGALALAGSPLVESFDLPTLAHETHYYWRIDVEDANGTTLGSVWDFTTAVAPCAAVPTAACSPVPSLGGTDVLIDADLSWSCGESQCALPVTYNVYFGTNPGALTLAGSPSSQSFDLPTLAYSTHYYWRIDAQDANGTTPGPVWDFTTSSTPCVAVPTAPCTPAPATGGTDLAIDTDLAWACGDSQCALPVTYNVYFGTNPGALTLAGSPTTKSWALPPLAYETHYYWRVDAQDANGTTSSPVWDFTTSSTPCLTMPVAACSPLPETGGANIPVDSDLAWSCGDSQCGLSVTYWVYFGTNPSPGANELVGSSSTKSFDLLPMAFSTQYYWRVDAQDANGTTSSPVWSFTSAAEPCVAVPTAPCTPVPATGGNDLAIDTDLAWSCGDSQCALPVTYNVYFGTNPGALTLAGSPSTKSFALPTLAYSTQYYWRVDAQDANGTTPSPVWSFTTAAAPCVAAPTTPCTPVPVAGGTDLAIDTDLAWSCGDSQCALPVTYHVYFGTDSGALTLAGSPSSKSFDLPTLAYQTNYYWRVDAQDANGTTPSPVWSFTTTAAPCVAAPTEPCSPAPAAGGTDLGIDTDLAWSCGDSQCALPVTYHVYFGTDSTPGDDELVGSPSSKSFDLPTLAYETHYYWRVDAQDANGTTSSQVWDFTTGAAPCVAPPTDLCSPVPAADGTDVDIETDLAWSCGDSQCGHTVTYRVFFGTTPDLGLGEFLGPTESKSWDLPSMTYETQYYWRIEAVDANGTTMGPVWSFTTGAAPCTDPPNPPCDPSPQDDEANVARNVNLFWGCGDPQCLGAVLYRVYFGEDE